MTVETQALGGVPTIPDVLPILPLRDMVLFPMAVAPVLVGQERSVRLVDDVMRGNRLIGVVAQRDGEARPAGPEDVYRVGTAAIIHQMLRSPDGTLRMILQGIERIRITDFVMTEPYLVGRVERAPDLEAPGLEVEALTRTLRDLFRRLVGLVPEMPDELVVAVESLQEPRQVAYLVASSAPLDVQTRQSILEIDTVPGKLRKLIELVQHELAVRELGRKIATDTQEQMSKAQREYYLREQLKAIQRELGEEDGEQAELRELRERLEQVPLSDEARREAERELRRLERLPAASPEHGIIRTYLDWLLSLPWGRATGREIDVVEARRVLDEDHYDLEKVKDRIIEYLAVRKLRRERGLDDADTETPREPILCFVGPPGVGKTSLGQSIARALGRKFVRISLGGVHDEAEIRGHRRTYIGAMPGRIIQALRRAEAADPVFMLDEVDKLGVGIHGDPSAALLEVLDPAQNNTFVDTYLGVPFDLSRVLFICTANTTDTIPGPVLDRMEILPLAGYTEEEKLFIARRYLLPKQLRAHGIAPNELEVTDAAIRRVAREYTREAGVRNLERELARICRKVAQRLVAGESGTITVDAGDLEDLLGPPRYVQETRERIDRPGVATGLAWTPTGGELLFVEAALVPSREPHLILTGMLGDVMRESAQAALTFVRSNAAKLGIDPTMFDDKDVHIHVPAGAIPKDGPSAGVTMATALASTATGRLVRADVAMTGEITLRGKVLPVGGIKEKVLAAHRAGIRTVILPKGNQRDLSELPEELRRAMTFVFADTVDDVIATALGDRAEATTAA
jgi:ATP-dependent Lon protease